MAQGTRALQVAFVALFVVCFAQVGWWMIDETWQSRRAVERLSELYARDAAAGEALLASGADARAVEELFPHVEVSAEGSAARASVRSDVLEELDLARRRRLNRFAWEGSFFLLVLIAGMAVILQALRQRTRLLQRQQNFLASVSHELKSPLASLRLAAETLLLRQPDAGGVRRLGERMVADAGRLEALVSNLLEVAQLEEGRVQRSPTTQPLLPLVRAAVDEVRPQLHAEVELAVPSELTVHADPEAFRSTLRNLLTNAGKSVAAKGGGTVRVMARPVPHAGARTAGARASRVEVEVADDGLGFERGEAERLFEKFYRPGDEMRRRTKGSGLGLYIARHHARAHGGDVTAESAGPGRGAAFTVRWPAEEPRR